MTAAVERQPNNDVLSAAPKAAVTSLIRSVALEEGRHGIRANAVGPGWIDTGLVREALADMPDGTLDRIVKAVPLRRIGAPEEVAHAVGFLLSGKAAYITGELICVAGGLQL